MKLQVALKETDYQNLWDIWVYPDYNATTIAEANFNGVTVTRDKKLFEKLYKADSPVLYIPMEKDIP